MEPTHLLQDDWQQLLAMLPDHREAMARQAGALQRRREVADADTLLRLALAYSWLGFSLRNTAAWAQQLGVATLSDVGVLKQLRQAAGFVQTLVGTLLQQRTTLRHLRGCGFGVSLVDASTVSAPGSTGTEWRVHLSLDLACLSITDLHVTDACGGESFTRFQGDPHHITVGDRGYSHRQGIAHLAGTGGHVLVRLNWQNVPLLHQDGAAFDLFAALRSLPQDQIGDWAVRTAPEGNTKTPSIPGRLLAIRKSEAATEATRRQIRRQCQRKGRTPDARTLEAAEYLFVFTTVSQADLAAELVLELYRFRWQIELAFKRFKSLLGMGKLQAHDPKLCRTYLYSKLLAALLMEDLSHRSAFSPWDLAPEASALAVALDPDAVAYAVPGDWLDAFEGFPSDAGADVAPLLRYAAQTRQTDRTSPQAKLAALATTALS